MPSTHGGEPGGTPPGRTSRLVRLLAAVGAALRDRRTGPRTLLLSGLSSALIAGSVPALPAPWWESGAAGGGATVGAQTLRLPFSLPSASHTSSTTPTEIPAALPEAVSVPEAADPRVEAVASLLRGMPLEPHAEAMVAAADRHGIDWRLMPVISILESQGGLTACGGNAWGYANCGVRFASFEEGIETVAATLARYGRLQPAVKMCIWVSGRGCSTRHAVDYVYRGAGLYARLGGQLWLPAYPAEEVSAAAPPAPTETSTPVPTGTPAPTGTPSATPSPAEGSEPASTPVPTATAVPTGELAAEP